MIRKPVDQGKQAKDAYTEAMTKNAVLTLTKCRLNVPALFLGRAFGKENAEKEKYGTAYRFYVCSPMGDMDGRATFGSTEFKVTAAEDGRAIVFNSRPTKKNPDFPQIPVTFKTGTTAIVKVNVGQWFANMAPLAPVMIYDVNAATGNGKNGLQAYIAAAGAGLIDMHEGTPIGHYYDFESILRAATAADALVKAIPPFTSEMMDGGIYPECNPAFLIPVGEETSEMLERMNGAPWPMKANPMMSDHLKFFYETKEIPPGAKEKGKRATITTKLWVDQKAPDGDRPDSCVLNVSCYDDEIHKYGLVNEHPYHADLMIKTLLPFLIHAPRIMLVDVKLDKTNAMPENADSFRHFNDTNASVFDDQPGAQLDAVDPALKVKFGYSGTFVSWIDYPFVARTFGIRVARAWVEDFQKEIARKTVVSDPAIAVAANIAAKTTMENSGVVVINAATTSTDRVMGPLKEKNYPVDFYVLIPEVLAIQKLSGTKKLARDANALSITESTALLNFVLGGSKDLSLLSESSKKIFDDKSLNGLDGDNEPKLETLVVLAVIKPPKELPVYAMFKENVFGAPDVKDQVMADADSKGTAESEPPKDGVI